MSDVMVLSLVRNAKGTSALLYCPLGRIKMKHLLPPLWLCFPLGRPSNVDIPGLLVSWSFPFILYVEVTKWPSSLFS